MHRSEDLAGIARWLLSTGRHTEALDLFRSALAGGLPDEIAFRTLWDVFRVEKKLGRKDAAVAALSEIASCENQYRSRAFEELSKYHERHEKNSLLALEFTNSALACGFSAALLRRKARLEKKLTRNPERQRPNGRCR